MVCLHRAVVQPVGLRSASQQPRASSLPCPLHWAERQASHRRLSAALVCNEKDPGTLGDVTELSVVIVGTIVLR